MNWEGKRVLVAGGTGLVGTNLIKRLLPTRVKIRATYHIRQRDTTLPSVPPWLEWISCDLTKPEDCKLAVSAMDYVFMCAAAKAGAAVMAKDSLPLFTPNILMHTFMTEAAYHAGINKFLFLGSSTAYPESGEHPVKEEEMFNGDPWDKYFLVGWHKRFGEKLCEIFSEKLKRRMPCIALRPTNLYGAHDDFNFETSHVTPALIRRAVERQDPFTVWGDGSEVRDLVYVDDLIDAMLLAMDRVDGYDPINIGLGKGYSVKEILNTILEIEDFHPKVIFDTSKPTMIPKRLVDISKAEKVLGWSPKTDLREGLKKTIKWYKENKL